MDIIEEAAQRFVTEAIKTAEINTILNILIHVVVPEPPPALVQFTWTDAGAGIRGGALFEDTKEITAYPFMNFTELFASMMIAI